MSAATRNNSLSVKDSSTLGAPTVVAPKNRPVRGPKSPVELPEIVPVIATLLTGDRNALQTCCRVSKVFYDAFTPVLWSDLVLFHGPHKLLAALPAVDKHAGLVHTLTFVGNFSNDYCFLEYPNLRSLVILSDPDSTMDDGLPLGYTSLVKNHSNVLKSLKVYCRSLRRRPIFWEAVEKVKDLRHLDLTHVAFEGQDGATTFYNLGRNAKDISLKMIKLTTRAVPFLSGAPSPSPWQDVHFEKVGCFQPMFYCLIQRIVQSPGLRSLVLLKITNSDNHSENFSLESLVEEVERRRPCWPQLVRLHLQDCDLEDTQLETLLSSLDSCQIKDLNLAFTQFGPKAHAALIVNHSWNLRHLNLQKCKNVSSLMLHSILCSHARLVSIKGGKILATDLLADERDWVCNELQVWDLEIYMDERDPDHCCQVFLRLSSLSHLRTLILNRGRATASAKGRSSLPFQTDLGLELLQSLTQLEELHFDQREALEEDWDWILDSFRRLKNIVAPTDKTDEQRQEYLKRITQSNGRIQFCFF
ncbi:hypothetical protein EMPS_08482 [Entomortierella parvispora]|uniref:Uncharacterized protein n=1 Tax=Entomortierella parvispora TaxID=205924 RepID=A0A9P3HGG1_9FUNG|nr:hypothetical protein EMPS_08482 [Entomortierella parvispora]